jgi:hypothetical protein
MAIQQRQVCRRQLGDRHFGKRPGLWTWAIGLSPLIVTAGVATWCAAANGANDATSPAALIQAQLEAGEFGPARQLAGQVADAAERDALFSRIARSQAKAGARNAALVTASAMDNDLARAAAMQELGTSGSGRRGAFGGQQADFDSLIDLITTTIAPTTWDEVGGPGSIAEFRTGVYVDAGGVLQRSVREERPKSELDLIRMAARDASDSHDARRASPLRKISLTRLERAVQVLAAEGRRPTEEMSLLAGLERVKYVLVYPETGDIVIAGPADHWRPGPEGRLVAETSGRPVVRLDDFVVVLRHLMHQRNAIFGCSITPTEENLKRTQTFLAASAEKPLKPGQRDAWLKQLRAQMGQQVIDVDGIDPRTRAGQVLVEADYHMKLIGMGLEKGTLGVTSYLDSIKVPAGEAPPPLDVLRWWFTMNYDTVRASADHNAFELRGSGVQVLSENEMLTAQGKRVHTGASQPLNQAFTQSFTDHFAALAEKYPVYAELQNIFDLALVAAIFKAENLPDRVNWHMTCYGDPGQYLVPLGPAPRTVETVINHRVVNKIHILAGVSGGVQVDPWKYVAPGAVKADTSGKLKTELGSARPGSRPSGAWWWD